MRRRVVVIGGGMGGLACAIDLAGEGCDVTLVEKADGPGGKMREAAVGPARIDAGPTILTMRWVFDALFARAGASLDAHVTLKPAAVLARHAWSEDQRLDLYADLDRSADAVGDLAGAEEAKGFRSFSAESARIYDALRDTFLAREKCGLVGLSARILGTNPPALFGLRPYETLWGALGDHFRDARMRQLFGRYATYCGSSPFKAPATLMLIVHVERQGVWLVEGGMRRLAEALASLAAARGVTLRYGQEAARIEVEHGRASGVVLASGERLGAEAVVANADAAALSAGAFGEEASRAVPARPTSARSLSAVTWAEVSITGGFPLARHNVFFSGDSHAEFADLAAGRIPADPTIYVCAQDRDDRGARQDGAPEGAPERLFTLINAPPDGDRRALDAREVSACGMRLQDRLGRCGLEVRPGSDPPTVTTPRDFEAMFPGSGGGLYGSAMHGWAAAFKRPGARTRIPGLYLAGGSAHPGAGAPMAALSGTLAASRLMADRASIFPSPRAATAGGMSTRSATTAASA